MTRLRSPGYPSASLEVAIEYAEKIYTQNRTNAIDRESTAKSMGYSGSSGASDKTIANLTHYGLIQKAGKGDVRVTQLAVDILRPENDKARIKSLHEAAFSPQLFSLLRAKFPDGHFSSDALKNTLARMGFQEVAIPSASKAYTETCQHLKQLNAYESNTQTQTTDTDTDEVGDEPRQFGEARVGDLVQWEANGLLMLDPPQRVRGVSDDGEWVFIESTSTGIPMNEIIVKETQQHSKAARKAPEMPLANIAEIRSELGEIEWMRNKVGSETTVRIMVKGEIGPKEIGKLIKLLEAQKSVLEDD